ncbi:unnamed protein product [Arabidopsis thaliana]|uniref:Zinc finger PHD-type domain-containing protein n=2 Tax=Arabidopsis thaliana TaxID=3702 RepID=A0A654F981_ARATH|nr:zinc ion binding protein [Arabidopsis thaliana]AAP04166.1 putative CHP-rich zinc finger protein [Arabidopsis thaliana]AAP40346.1 putative CHP-rich zinc finger protein [Arabidopsis thaliana]AEE76476.1 zinc ion binding protein [Arabidopsis thaliana]VYS58104.1 unnamed protein product [Arabidopsis thaliana]BAF00490.1 hypothetical protein [Arabidopsis thaliana]|eukprot:NP_188758.2 zinc ion binding protein [Arabidopsis thaliana]
MMNPESDHPSSPRQRKIGIAVELSEESAFTVRWAVDNYIRQGDDIIILHVSPTAGLFGADWGYYPLQTQPPYTTASIFSKVADLGKPLKEAGFPHTIHTVKDYDKRERLCLETQRLNLTALIMGFGDGSVSDFCVHHCVCQVVVVRYPDGPGSVEGTRAAPIVTFKSRTDDDEEIDKAKTALTASVHHQHIKAMDSVSKQPLLFCPRAYFTNNEEDFRAMQFREPPNLSSPSFHLTSLVLGNDFNITRKYYYDRHGKGFIKGHRPNKQCEICSKSLLGTTFYSCTLCLRPSCSPLQSSVLSRSSGYYHEACIEPISKHPYHPKHALRFRYESGQICLSCSTFKDFAYHCSICNFTMCQDCAREPPLFAIDYPKRHEHTLFYFQRKGSLICDVCGLSDGRSLLYSCVKCNFVVHKECVYFPCIIKISRHEHRLSFNSSLTPEQWLCGVCRESIDTNFARYSCVKGCSFAVHSKCATRKDVWDGKELEGEPEEDESLYIFKSFNEISDGIIEYFRHKSHHMRLDEDTNRAFDEDKRCRACTFPICDDLIYSCMQCDFILHQTCAHLPPRKQHATHPHPLLLLVDEEHEDYFQCTACKRESNGFAYTCCARDCNFTLDVSCASIAESLIHRFHPHPIYLIHESTAQEFCSICGQLIGHRLNCGECRFALCFGCATLPNKLRYKHDEHFLIFSYDEDFSGSQESGPHLCEVCEKQANPKNGVYMCNDCNVTLHVECLLGKEMYMMPIGGLISRNVNVDILPNNRLTRNICQRCHNRCQGKIIFKARDRSTFLCSLFCCLTKSWVDRDT